MDAEGRCGLCRHGLTGFDSVVSYGEYGGALRKLIHLFKYGGISSLADPLGKLLAKALPLDSAFDVIVPMPLHWTRRWKRGFNQCELLARSLSKRIGVPVLNATGRRRRTATQAGLSSSKRRLNVVGAFRAKKRIAVKGQHVLLLDDVFTTGATASACAAALKRAGARRVTVVTVARVDRRASSRSVAS